MNDRHILEEVVSEIENGIRVWERMFERNGCGTDGTEGTRIRVYKEILELIDGKMNMTVPSEV